LGCLTWVGVTKVGKGPIPWISQNKYVHILELLACWVELCSTIFASSTLQGANTSPNWLGLGWVGLTRFNLGSWGLKTSKCKNCHTHIFLGVCIRGGREQGSGWDWGGINIHMGAQQCTRACLLGLAFSFVQAHEMDTTQNAS
jgi:hypothetical protein